MDCRKPLFAALWFVGGLAGCATTSTTPTSQPPTSGQINNVPIVKAADPPKRPPSSRLCTALADDSAERAKWPETTEIEAQGLRDVARKSYQQAISMDPKYLPAYQGLTRLYVDMKDYTHAVATYQEALKHFPKEPSLYYELGMCYGRQGQWEPMLQNLNKAVELDPESRKYLRQLAYGLAWTGHFDDSLAVFKRAQPEAEAHYNLAWLLWSFNEPDLCRQQLQAALQKDPQMQCAQALLAKLDVKETPPEIEKTSFSEQAPR